jgi:hypothetical protein
MDVEEEKLIMLLIIQPSMELNLLLPTLIPMEVLQSKEPLLANITKTKLFSIMKVQL